MLKEILKVRQIPGESTRRWFNSEDMDLIIWYADDVIIGFQLCYDKKNQEKALSWKPETGLVHETVDDGESRDGHYKATPILVENGQYDLVKIKKEFGENSQNISKEVKEFVLNNL